MTLQQYCSPCLIVLGVVILGIILIYIFTTQKGSKENFNSFGLGARGKYQDILYRCNSQCEKQDLRKTMGTDILCDEYCDDEVSKLVREEAAVPTIVEPNNIEMCYSACSSNFRTAKQCREECHCQLDVDEKCRQDCAFASYLGDTDSSLCLDQCHKSYKANCIGGGGYSFKG